MFSKKKPRHLGWSTDNHCPNHSTGATLPWPTYVLFGFFKLSFFLLHPHDKHLPHFFLLLLKFTEEFVSLGFVGLLETYYKKIKIKVEGWKGRKRDPNFKLIPKVSNIISRIHSCSFPEPHHSNYIICPHTREVLRVWFFSAPQKTTLPQRFFSLSPLPQKNYSIFFSTTLFLLNNFPPKGTKILSPHKLLQTVESVGLPQVYFKSYHEDNEKNCPQCKLYSKILPWGKNLSEGEGGQQIYSSVVKNSTPSSPLPRFCLFMLFYLVTSRQETVLRVNAALIFIFLKVIFKLYNPPCQFLQLLARGTKELLKFPSHWGSL